MAKRNKGQNKQKALLKLRLEFLGVNNMDRATLEQMKNAMRRLSKPYDSFMGFVIGEKRLAKWNAFLKDRKKASQRDRAVLNDKALRHDLHVNEREVSEFLGASYG